MKQCLKSLILNREAYGQKKHSSYMFHWCLLTGTLRAFVG